MAVPTIIRVRGTVPKVMKLKLYKKYNIVGCKKGE